MSSIANRNAAVRLERTGREQRPAEYYAGPRPDLLAEIPAGRGRVLDVGCGYGVMGAALKQRDGCRVVGVEQNAEAAKEARSRLDAVYVQDASAPIPEREFDCIVYGDVLEHLVDPWAVLRAHVGLLQPCGYVVMSVPNVQHFSVLWMLLVRGRWRYAESGIMDRTHLRFFTLRDIREMAAQAGLEVEHVAANRDAWSWKSLAAGVALGWLAPDCLVTQWILRCRRCEDRSSTPTGTN